MERNVPVPPNLQVQPQSPGTITAVTFLMTLYVFKFCLETDFLDFDTQFIYCQTLNVLFVATEPRGFYFFKLLIQQKPTSLDPHLSLPALPR